jgi:hypothetical protein
MDSINRIILMEILDRIKLLGILTDVSLPPYSLIASFPQGCASFGKKGMITYPTPNKKSDKLLTQPVRNLTDFLLTYTSSQYSSKYDWILFTTDIGS